LRKEKNEKPVFWVVFFLVPLLEREREREREREKRTNLDAGSKFL